MEHFDQSDQQAYQALDDHQLEAVRVAMVTDRDYRLELVIRVQVTRSIAVIERVCRSRGAARGIGRDEIAKAIDDAAIRTLLRLRRPERQPAVQALAAEIAVACVAARSPQPPRPPRLAARRPELRLLEGLGEAIAERRVHPNEWRGS